MLKRRPGRRLIRASSSRPSEARAGAVAEKNGYLRCFGPIFPLKPQAMYAKWQVVV